MLRLSHIYFLNFKFIIKQLRLYERERGREKENEQDKLSFLKRGKKKKGVRRKHCEQFKEIAENVWYVIKDILYWILYGKIAC